VQANCLCDFNNRFLSIIIVVVVIIVVTIIIVALAFAFALAFVLAFVFLTLTFIFLLSFVLFLASFSLIIILLAFVALFNSFLDRNIKYICELKKIKTKLRIYNNNLILLLRICFRTYFVCYIFFDN